MCLEVENI